MDKQYGYENLLSCDTSGSHCVVTVQTQTKRITKLEISKKHAVTLPEMIDGIMNQVGINYSEIGAVLVNHGPGAFTGIRIAMATAQGLVMGRSIPIISYSHLQIWAYGAYQHLKCVEKNQTIKYGIENNKDPASKQNQVGMKVFVGLDARMEEMYLGQYDIDINGREIIKTKSDTIINPTKIDSEVFEHMLEQKECRVVFVGPAWTIYGNVFKDKNKYLIMHLKESGQLITEDFFENTKLKKTEIMLDMFLNNQGKHEKSMKKQLHGFDDLNYLRNNVAKKKGE